MGKVKKKKSSPRDTLFEFGFSNDVVDAVLMPLLQKTDHLVSVSGPASAAGALFCAAVGDLEAQRLLLRWYLTANESFNPDRLIAAIESCAKDETEARLGRGLAGIITFKRILAAPARSKNIPESLRPEEWGWLSGDMVFLASTPAMRTLAGGKTGGDYQIAQLGISYPTLEPAHKRTLA